MGTHEANIPRHNVIDSSFTLDLSSVSVMCHGTRFEITVSIKDLSRSAFEDQYRQLVPKVHGDQDESVNDYEQLCDWILEPCFPIFRELAPLPKRPAFSLENYYYPTTYFLRVFASNGHLHSGNVMHPKKPFSNALLVPLRSLPDFPHIQKFNASKIQIIPDPKNNDHLCDMPQKVQIQDGSVKYFKPSFETSQFVWEASTFLEIRKAKLPDNIKISKLSGMVLSNNGEMALGLLVDWIPSIGSLQSNKAKQMRTQHVKWEQQVRETVQVLHNHGIIWGDVHPGNIVIDANLDAWVIDFGGGWVEHFVDRKISGTQAGDWQGVQRVFDQLAEANSVDTY